MVKQSFMAVNQVFPKGIITVQKVIGLKKCNECDECYNVDSMDTLYLIQDEDELLLSRIALSSVEELTEDELEVLFKKHNVFKRSELVEVVRKSLESKAYFLTIEEKVFCYLPELQGQLKNYVHVAFNNSPKAFLLTKDIIEREDMRGALNIYLNSPEETVPYKEIMKANNLM